MDFSKDELIYAFDMWNCQNYECISNSYQPWYFFSKYPDEVSPIFNLVYLFTPLIWGLTFMSIFGMVFFFYFSSWVYSKLGYGKHISGNNEIILCPFRIRMMSYASKKNIDVGFSSSCAALIWAIWGGMIAYMLESNYLAVLTKPTFEKPIRNLDDFIATSKGVFTNYPTGNMSSYYLEIGEPRFIELARRMYEPNDVEHWEQLMMEVHTNDNADTDIYIDGFMDPKYYELGWWYRSKKLP